MVKDETTLEARCCDKALKGIGKDIRDINYKLDHLIEVYRAPVRTYHPYGEYLHY